jgi:Zn-dependent protease with chaperone function
MLAVIIRIVRGLYVLGQAFPDWPEIEQRCLDELQAKHREQPQWTAQVATIFRHLVRKNAIEDKLQVRVFEMPMNAYALAHRTVVISRELVAFCQAETSQLAFVLSHEIAHIVLGHTKDKARTDFLMGAFSTGHAVAHQVTRKVINQAFSRENEYEADRQALIYCRRAGYRPESALDLFDLFQQLGDPRNLCWLLDTHPPFPERIAAIKRHLSEY